jgi:glutamine synthetase adenylyltransferase
MSPRWAPRRWPRLPRLPAELADLIRGTAGCSPYLRGLLAREAEWCEAALAGAPETALEAVLADLRQAKRRVALLAALADLGGVWTLEEVTDALTRSPTPWRWRSALRAELGAARRAARSPA